MKRASNVLFALTAVFMLAGSARAAAPTSVTLASSKNLWAAVPIIAEKKGFFAGEGLDVHLEYVQAAKFAMDALVSGQAQFSTLVELNVAFLGYNGNRDLHVVATVVKSYDSAIVARRSAGIVVPADLSGKQIGVLPATTSAIFADRFLAKHGIAPGKVTLQNLQPIAIQTSIVQHQIDAGSVWQPFILNITNALGKNDTTVFTDPAAYTGYMNIAVQASWQKQNPQTIAAFLRALDKAKTFIEAHPAEAQRMLAGEVGLDEQTVKAIWKDYRFVTELDAPTLVGAISDEARWIQKTQPGFSQKLVPVYDGYLDGAPLRAVQGH